MKKITKILLILSVAFLSFIVTSKVEAASATISASKTTATVGDNVSVNISFNAAAWNLHVSGTGVSSSSYADTTNNGENAKTTKSLKVDTSSAGTKTIKLTGDVTDGTTGKTTNINKSVTITVNKASSNGNNNSNNNANNNSNNNSNNNTAPSTDPAPSFTAVNETVYAKSKANVRSSYSTSSSIVGSLKIGDSVTRTGIGSNGWSKITYNGKTAYVSSSLITKTKPEEPNEADKPNEMQTPDKKDDLKLDSLKIKDYNLKPEFSKDIHEYELNVENEVEKLEIEAISEDKDVVIEITDNENLKVGENIITITISKEKIEEKIVYTIKAIKEDSKQEQTETTVTINQDGLNEEIDRVNSKLKVREWTIRGIIIFVTVLIIIMIILRYLTVKKENAQDFDYVNIRDKFNELEDVDDTEEQQIEEQEVEELDEENYNIQEDVKDNIQDNDNIGYRFKRSKKSKGKH